MESIAIFFKHFKMNGFHINNILLHFYTIFMC